MPLMFHEQAGDPNTLTGGVPYDGGSANEIPPEPETSDDWTEYLVTHTSTHEGREDGWYCTTTGDALDWRGRKPEGWAILIVDC
jgi:hypothetical protein